MIHEACFVTGAVVLSSCAAFGSVWLLGYAWWLVIERFIAPRIGTNRLFFETAVRILNERKAKDSGQLSHPKWPSR